MPIQPRNRNMTTETKPVAWPDGDETWWLMRYRKSSRGTWRILLVRPFNFEGGDYVTRFRDDKYYSRTYCESMEASFVPAGPLPDDWCDD